MQADKKKVTRLLKTARGQIDGILRMVEKRIDIVWIFPTSLWLRRLF